MNINKIVKSTLLNVDSSTRVTVPKYIYKSDGKFLPSDPLYFTKDSSEVKINYPNNQLSPGDNIIIQNVAGPNKILFNSFYLFNNFNYLVINYPNHNIPNNYAKYSNQIFANILLYGDVNISNIISNISLNSFIGVNQLFIMNDITIPTDIANYLNKFSSNDLLFVKLEFNYKTNQSQLETVINQTFSVTFLSIGGINVGYINSNFPINNYNFQSNQTITKVEPNYIYMTINSIKGAYNNISGGGNNIQIMRIIDTIEGYPYSNNYSIELKHSFKNVIYVELLSTEFPYIDYSIKNNINNKFYWQNIEDGPSIYSVAIDEGFYNLDKLISNLVTQINKEPRIISTSNDPIYNNFSIQYDKTTNKIVFSAYNFVLSPNSLSVVITTIDNIDYYQLQVKQDNNTVSIGDIITIQNAMQVSIINSLTQNTSQQINTINQEYIPASYINNQNFTVTSLDTSNNIYNVLLGKVANINKITNSIVSLLPSNNNNNLSYISNLINLSNDQLQTLTNINELCNTSQITIDSINQLENNKTYSYGGNDIMIKQNTKIRLLFNMNDTFGDILGFKNVGNIYSITPFNKTISNFDNYIVDNKLNSIGDIIQTNNLINLSGQNTYFLMYLNNIEFINNINIPTAFAKILLSGNQGDYLFNTFVRQSSDIYSQSFPIPEITRLDISYLFPDGTMPDFRNINHSFTLKIVEEVIQSNDIQKNSNHTHFINEMKQLH